MSVKPSGEQRGKARSAEAAAIPRQLRDLLALPLKDGQRHSFGAPSSLNGPKARTKAIRRRSGEYAAVVVTLARVVACNDLLRGSKHPS